MVVKPSTLTKVHFLIIAKNPMERRQRRNFSFRCGRKSLGKTTVWAENPIHMVPTVAFEQGPYEVEVEERYHFSKPTAHTPWPNLCSIIFNEAVYSTFFVLTINNLKVRIEHTVCCSVIKLM